MKECRFDNWKQVSYYIICAGNTWKIRLAELETVERVQIAELETGKLLDYLRWKQLEDQIS